MYVRNIFNPNYIEEVDAAAFYNNRQRFSEWQPLNREESEAEDIYRKHVKPHEKSLAVGAFTQGMFGPITEAVHRATGGRVDLRLTDHQKILLGKYKQRSTVGQALGFMGSAAGIIGLGGVGGAFLKGEAIALGAARTGAVARTAFGVGEAAGMTVHTAEERIQRQKLNNLIGKGKYVTDQSALEIYKKEGITNALLVGAFGALGSVYRAGKGRLVAKGREVSKMPTATQQNVERGFKLTTLGVDPKKAAKRIPKMAKGDKDPRVAVGKALEPEMDDIIGATLKREGKEATTVDLERTLQSRLKHWGERFAGVKEKAQKMLDKAGPSKVLEASLDLLKKVSAAGKKIGPASSQTRNIANAIDNNLFFKRKVKVGGKTQTVRELDKNFFENLQDTKDYVYSLIQQSTSKKATGRLRQILKQIMDLEDKVLKGLRPRLHTLYKGMSDKYSRYRVLDSALQTRMGKAGAEHMSERALRNVAWASIIGGGGVLKTLGAIGAGGFAGGFFFGPMGYLGGAVVGALAHKVARAGYAEPWRMSIYPSIYQRANMYLRGGKSMPDIVSRNIDQTVRRRFQFLDNISKGIKSIPEGTFRRPFIKQINDWTEQEKVDFLEGIREETSAAFSDPQILNNIAFSNAELISQAGGSSFAPQVIMDTIQGLRDILESFPKDREVPRADDLAGNENLWSKKQIKTSLRRLEAFFEPDDVLEEMVTGQRDIDIDQVQYLNTFHPYYFNAMRQWMMIGLNNGNLKLSRKEKLRYSYIFNLPISTAAHPALLSITEQTAGLALARQAQQKEQIRKNLNIERKADSLKTAAERSMLNEDHS